MELAKYAIMMELYDQTWDDLHLNIEGRVQRRFQNIACRVGPAALKGYLPCPHFTCPATLLKKCKLHYKDSAQNITCQAGQVRLLFCLPNCHFCAKFTYNLQQGKWLCCTLEGASPDIGLTDNSIDDSVTPTTTQVQILAYVCEKVASDLGGFLGYSQRLSQDPSCLFFGQAVS